MNIDNEIIAKFIAAALTGATSKMCSFSEGALEKYLKEYVAVAVKVYSELKQP